MKEYIIPRIGHGYDVHRLTEDRELILGGVKIDYTLGLLGHSDADVLTHAVMDALLGAAAPSAISAAIFQTQAKNTRERTALPLPQRLHSCCVRRGMP